jgi:hypothetical protein
MGAWRMARYAWCGTAWRCRRTRKKKKVRSPLLATIALAFAGLATLAACSHDSDTSFETRVISGEIQYAGDVDGALEVAAFDSFPPTGAPVASVRIEDPQFPQRYEIHGVPAGRYFVLAIVDRVPEDGNRYRPAVDPGGAFGAYELPGAVSIDALERTEGVNVTLVDPSDSSPWARQGYD